VKYEHWEVRTFLDLYDIFIINLNIFQPIFSFISHLERKSGPRANFSFFLISLSSFSWSLLQILIEFRARDKSPLGFPCPWPPARFQASFLRHWDSSIAIQFPSRFQYFSPRFSVVLPIHIFLLQLSIFSPSLQIRLFTSKASIFNHYSKTIHKIRPNNFQVNAVPKEEKTVWCELFNFQIPRLTWD